MKAYIMSIPASIRGVSDKLNIQSQLCDRTWRVYNEEDVKVIIKNISETTGRVNPEN
jgi:hypothetical protein